MVSAPVLQEPQQVSWVACELCEKWRRLPSALVAALPDDATWVCSQNPDPAFASCSVLQELSNEQIEELERELHIDEDDRLRNIEDAAVQEERARRRRVPAVWQLIRDNILTHRKRRLLQEDDVMICQCKPTWRGGDGCGPDCINRMLCIECVPGFCPSEHHCTNQVFSKKQYAKLQVRRAGAKGFGLFALEPIQAGQFVIEYIGEVLEEEEYLRRKDFYAEVGVRHYYFMNIGNGEVIDAARKGNRARFINHSCDPNCETQKWNAQGELAIGLYALKDIAAGEELTFDYNFERYGDKPLRCYCGTRTCRKFIGGLQDGTSEAQLAEEEGEGEEDASNDFQPIMLADSDMDWASRAWLDWRVGYYWDDSKEAAVLTKLERVCRARGVPWTAAHFYGTAALPSAAETGDSMIEPADALHRAVAAGTRAVPAPTASAAPQAAVPSVLAAPAAQTTRAAAAATAEQQAEKPPRSKAKTVAPRRDSHTGLATQPAPATTAELALHAGSQQRQVSIPRVAPVAPSHTPPVAVDLRPCRTASAQAHSEAASDVYSQQLLKREDEGHSGQLDAAAASDHKLLLDGMHTQLAGKLRLHAPVPVKAEVRGEAQSAGEGQEDVSSDEQSAQGQLVQQERHAKGVRKRVSLAPGLGGQPGLKEPLTGGTTSATEAGATSTSSAVSAAPVQADAREGLSKAADAETAPSTRAPQATAQRGSQHHQQQQSQHSGPGGLRRRSDIDRRLDELVGPSGRLKEASRQNIVKVLRMFNLCDAGPQRGTTQPVLRDQAARLPPAGAVLTQRQQQAQVQSSVREGPQEGGDTHSSDRDTTTVVRVGEVGDIGVADTSATAAHKHDGILEGTAASRGQYAAGEEGGAGAGGYAPLPRDRTAGAPGAITARQRARMADLSMLLDVVLKTSSVGVRKEFIACGLLNQLQQALGRNWGRDYLVILRKVLRVLDGLPLTADDVYSTRTAHGTLADTLQELATNPDYEVRSKAGALIKRYPVSACTEPPAPAPAPVRARRGPTGFSPLLAPGTAITTAAVCTAAAPGAAAAQAPVSPAAPTQGAAQPLQGPALAAAGTTATAAGAAEPVAARQPRIMRPVSQRMAPYGLPQMHTMPYTQGAPYSLTAVPPAPRAVSQQHSFWLPPPHDWQHPQDQWGGPLEPQGTPVQSPVEYTPERSPLHPSVLPSLAHNPTAASQSQQQQPQQHALPAHTPMEVAPAGVAAGSEPAKRRRRGFHDGPLPPPPAVDSPLLQLQGPAAAAPAPPTALDRAPGRLSSTPAPATVEELFALLWVPERQSRGPPAPTPIAAAADKTASGSEPWGPHGKPTSVEALFAVQLYDRDWLGESCALAVSRHSRAAGARGAGSGPCLAPAPAAGPKTQGGRAGAGARVRGWDQRPTSPLLPSPSPAVSGQQADIWQPPLSPIRAMQPQHWSPIRQPLPERRQEELQEASQSSQQVTVGLHVAQADVTMAQEGYSQQHTAQQRPAGAPLAPHSSMPLVLDLRGPPPTASPLHPAAGITAGTAAVPSQPALSPCSTGFPPNTHHQQQQQYHMGVPLSVYPGMQPPSPSMAHPEAQSMVLDHLPPLISMQHHQVQQGHHPFSPAAQALHSPAAGTPAWAPGRGMFYTPHPQPHTQQLPLYHPGGVPGVQAAGAMWPQGTPLITTTDPEVAEWWRPMPTHFPEMWEEPDDSFAAYVSEMVRFRLGKYLASGHPNQITPKDAHVLYKKLHREVVDKERQAFDGRKVQAAHKLIERRKVEMNLKEFVRLSIKRHHTLGA